MKIKSGYISDGEGPEEDKAFGTPNLLYISRKEVEGDELAVQKTRRDLSGALIPALAERQKQ